MSDLPGTRLESRDAEDPVPRLRHVALVQLIATLALAVSTLVAVTVVSIGFARALDAPIAVAPVSSAH
jgi:hypothetical protein